MDLFELTRPGHVDQPAWEAIELARTRLLRAWEFQDLPEVVGKAKELVETVAKVTVAAIEGAVADSADFVPIVKAAQSSLKRQAGADLSPDQNLRAIAQAAQTMATSLAPIRNAYGTGHGRALVPDVADEMASLAMESALVWCRWALRRLGHLLADYPNDLIDAVQIGTSRALLRAKFEAAALAQQPPEIQHRIGVAFGQQSAGGFGNATQVGVEPVVDGGYEEYPVDYRRGLLEGMLLTAGGSIGLTDFYSSWFVAILATLPDANAIDLLSSLRHDVADASWIQLWRTSTPVEPAVVVATLRAQGDRLSAAVADSFESFCSDLLLAEGAGTAAEDD